MKKILFLTKSDEIGGLEKVLFDISNLLDKEKYEITIMSGLINKNFKESLPINVKYKSLFKKRFRGLDRILIYFPSKILHKIFIKDFYDIEIAFQEGYPTKIISGANSKTKKICWLHNNPNYYDFNSPYFLNEKQLKKAFLSFNKIVAVSNFIAYEYKRYLNLDIKIDVIYNPIDFELINKLSNEKVESIYKVNKNIFRICYVGRLSDEKQIEILIGSIIKLKRNYTNLELFIIGEGHKAIELENLVNRNNSNDYIKFLGSKKNPYKYMKQCNLLVCPSKTESFSLVVAESMALGIPVVSTKCGGPEELLKNGKYGILTDNNMNSLAKGIEKAININMYNRLKNIKQRKLDIFDKHIIIKKIENLLNG